MNLFPISFSMENLTWENYIDIHIFAEKVKSFFSQIRPLNKRKDTLNLNLLLFQHESITIKSAITLARLLEPPQKPREKDTLKSL